MELTNNEHVIGHAKETGEKLLALHSRLNVIEKLETKINWLYESFNNAEHQKIDTHICFYEWHTDITVISELMSVLVKDIRELYIDLNHLNEGLFEYLTEVPGGSSVNVPTGSICL
ncbi:hypothetical protein [Bacillus ndiopicus]|uniref:hypothetical protein n=1 Tax=Bacillus ndiopicus TaxID=1347368 RepID=UPI0005AA82A3|nr:hypothetical protein [Bacillus ndiopicus]